MQTYTIESADNLQETFAAIRKSVAKAARDEMRSMQRDPMWRDPVVYVDGKRAEPERVKDFGTIVILPQGGPVEEAVQLAHQYVLEQAGFHHNTGFYMSEFAWYMNGKPEGSSPPDVQRMGLKGNVQLVNRAGYASSLEVLLPNHVIYGAYTLLKKTYGQRLALSYSYGPATAFDQAWPDARQVRASRPKHVYMAVPILTIGHPTATFRQQKRRPGVLWRKRRRELERVAKELYGLKAHELPLPKLPGRS